MSIGYRPLANTKCRAILASDIILTDNASFSIEAAGGEFLGECGAGISETVGADQATAFEIWMFDKNDITTVTKVLASEYAYGDSALSAKLASRGELVPARPGAIVKLETKGLTVRVRIVEIEYGAGEPWHNFFNKLTLELGVWPKGA